jgi:hypothetical protein
MTSKRLNSIGSFTTGIAITVEDGTPIGPTGKTAAELDREVVAQRAVFTYMSRIGLGLVLIGFCFQLWAVCKSPS